MALNFSKTRCDGGTLYRHDPCPDDPYFEMEIGQCPECGGKGCDAFKIVPGETYVNGRGDICGPMDERTPGVFLDQHGAVYHADGKEWNHLEGSTANLMALATPHPETAVSP